MLVISLIYFVLLTVSNSNAEEFLATNEQLFKFIHSGNLTAVEIEINSSGIDINADDSNGFTALSLSAKEGQLDIVRLLLSIDGIDVNKGDLNGKTPLLWASSKEHYAVVSLLLNHSSIDVNKADNKGRTALFWSSWKGQ